MAVGSGVDVGVGAAVGRGVDVGVGVDVALGAAVGRGVAVELGVDVGMGVDVALGIAVGLGVAVGDGVAAGARVGEGVGAGVGIGVSAGGAVALGVEVGTGVSVASAATAACTLASTVAAMSGVGGSVAEGGAGGWLVVHPVRTTPIRISAASRCRIRNRLAARMRGARSSNHRPAYTGRRHDKLPCHRQRIHRRRKINRVPHTGSGPRGYKGRFSGRNCTTRRIGVRRLIFRRVSVPGRSLKPRTSLSLRTTSAAGASRLSPRHHYQNRPFSS